MKKQKRFDKFVAALQFIIIATLILRLFFAYEWIASGSDKLNNIINNPQKYFEGLQNVFSKVWPDGTSATKPNPYPFMIDFLKNVAAPNTSTIVTIVAITELTLGVFYLFGFLVRPATFVGIILNAIFFLAAGHTSVSTAGINFIMIGGQIFMLLVSAGRAYGIDGLLSNKFKTKVF